MAPKKVYVGDASRRWSLAMPPSLASFQQRVRRAYKLSDGAALEIWLHPLAHRQAPSYGRELIRNESEYKCIVDDDVIVIVVTGGQALRPNEALLAEFNGETTYKSDFVPKSRKPRASPRVESRWQHEHEVRPGPGASAHAAPPAAFEVPAQYQTTYSRDYVKKNIHYKERKPYEPAERRKEDEPFLGQTTYGRDYVRKRLDPAETPPRFVLGGLGVVTFGARRKDTTFRNDFVGYALKPLERPPKAENAPAPRGAVWMATEYKGEYIGRRAPSPRPQKTIAEFAPLEFAPPTSTTTYARDFHTHPLHGARQIHVDPLSEVILL
jgi:hypothetical protein